MSKAFQNLYKLVVPKIVTSMVNATACSQYTDMRHWCVGMRQMTPLATSLVAIASGIRDMGFSEVKTHAANMAEHIPHLIAPNGVSTVHSAIDAFEQFDGPTVQDWLWLTLIQSALDGVRCVPSTPYHSFGIAPVTDNDRMEWQFHSVSYDPIKNTSTNNMQCMVFGKTYPHFTWFYKDMVNQFGSQLAFSLRNLDQFLAEDNYITSDTPDNIADYREFLGLDQYTPRLHA